jgi:transcriptional regulator with XRE-family HTH domain
MAPLSGVNPDDSPWSWLAYDLRRYRELGGLAQTHVGRIIKVTKQQVHNLESGYRKPNKGQTEALDRAWDTSGTSRGSASSPKAATTRTGCAT